MEDKNLQVENGNFTRIINPVIEELIKIPFKGCELAVVLFIIRKTWGFQKTQDEISLTQLESALLRSRPTIVKAIKNLQLVNIAKLVKRGNSEKCSNLYKINKYIDTWQLVKLPQLVKCKRSTSKGGFTATSKGGLTHKRKIKENTKEIIQQSEIAGVNEIMNTFKKVNSSIQFGNKTQRVACNNLIKEKGFDDAIKIANYALSIQGEKYSPTVTTPHQLWTNYTKLQNYYNKNSKSLIQSL